MNIKSAIRFHGREATRLVREGRDKAARAHAIRELQLRKVAQIKREIKQERKAS